ncbi:Similar to NOF: 120.7 kDa protein in NOF-FB transposable element (Drosophila melanogaster) [Cotesia congregata]|uniref:Similar to NOF: 120.7 kDa protein in NOF-FB transposable element (Drosophila melanogaster) n=1 Tax=Cotesia congregata TaxID=51543 RepID=A0A8J2HFR6_COTCN|nr:Similar to NOF: 120.7 kDa protein in NOF-FB transposable element (Drosophila melanogaster) [Cotesia congregata]
METFEAVLFIFMQILYFRMFLVNYIINKNIEIFKHGAQDISYLDVLLIFQVRMPSKCRVPIDDAINVLIKYISYFASDQLPEWSSDVWDKMLNEPEFKDKTNIKENRREILTKARERCGYYVPKKNNDINNDDNDLDDDIDDSDQDDVKKDPDYYSNVYINEQKDFECFDVVLSRHLWNSIQKVTPIIKNDCNYPGLQPKVWTDTLALELWKQYRLKCAFVFKNGTIQQCGHYYATMIGRCKSKKCGNNLFCYIENDPGIDGDVIIKMNCRDTRFEKHDDVRRPLRGKKREEMRKEVKDKGVKASINEESRKLLQPGDTQCPLKKESTEKEYGVKPEDRRDLIKALMCIDETPIYRNSIKVVSASPFWVFYGTPSQIHCYREYQRLHKDLSSISIDATGGMARKFIDCGERTSAIFLYQIVINFYNTTISTYQMLSECHDTDKMVTTCDSSTVQRIPGEVVCDGSRALLNSIALAFNNQSLPNYIESCFNKAKNNTSWKPNTYIRLDTAHFIHTASSWKCWKSVNHKNVKNFYLYCIALLIQCKTLKDLEKMFVLILIVCSTEFDDSTIFYNQKYITPLNARTELENIIGNKNSKNLYHEIEENMKSMDFDAEKSTILNDEKDDPNSDMSTISSWIKDLVAISNNVQTTGKVLNCFYVPLFKESFLKTIKDFPLWTQVCTPKNKLRATSSYIEDSKEMLNREIGLPARVDILVKSHLKNLLGGVVVFQNNLTKFVDDNIDKSTISNDSNCDDAKPEEKTDGVKVENSNDAKIEERTDDAEVEDSIDFENWRGLGNDMKHQNLDWINYANNLDHPTQDMKAENSTMELSNDSVVENLNKSIESEHDYSLKTSTPKTTQISERNKKNTTKKKGKQTESYLLINGNLSGPVIHNGVAFLAYNTCPFDSIVQLIFNGTLESKSFHEFLNCSENSTFKVALNLMKNGVKKNGQLYIDRFNILHNIYQQQELKQPMKWNDEDTNKVNTISRVIYCEDNVSALWNKLFQNIYLFVEVQLSLVTRVNMRESLIGLLTRLNCK